MRGAPRQTMKSLTSTTSSTPSRCLARTSVQDRVMFLAPNCSQNRLQNRSLSRHSAQRSTSEGMGWNGPLDGGTIPGFSSPVRALDQDTHRAQHGPQSPDQNQDQTHTAPGSDSHQTRTLTRSQTRTQTRPPVIAPRLKHDPLTDASAPGVTRSTSSGSDESSTAVLRRPLTVTEWSRQSRKWIVSARLEASGDWTLVGIFDEADSAFQAAEQASARLAHP